MRFDRIKIRNLGPFRDADVDLANLPGRVVAVTGANGAGKSTLLELLAGAAYRQCPTRGPLAGLATARDASVEVTAVNGAAWTIRQLVDGISGKGETVITDADGRTVVESAKLRDGDAWVKDHLPPPEVLYSSSVAVQGSRGFLDLSRAERKRVLLRLLGIERIEAQAEQARERAKEAKAETQRWREQRDAELAGAAVLEERQRLAESLAGEIEKADERVQSAEDALRRARAAAEDAERAAELAAQRRAAVGRVTRAEKQLDDVTTRLANNRDLLDQAAEVRKAVAESAELAARLPDLEAEFLKWSKAYDEAERAVREAEAEADRQEKRAAECDERLTEATRVVDDLGPRIARAERSAADLRRDLVDLEAATAAARQAQEDLQGRQLNHKDLRIGALRTTLADIRDTDEVEDMARVGLAAQGLDRDDAAAAEAELLPAAIEEGRAALRHAEKVEANARRGLSAFEAELALRGQLESAQSDATRWRAEKGKAEEAAKLERDSAHAGRVVWEAARKDSVAAQGAYQAAQKRRQELQPLVDRAPRLEQAETRIEELTAQATALEETLAAARVELGGLPEVPSDPGQVDLEPLKRKVSEAKASAGDLRDALGRARAGVEHAQAAKKRADEHAAKLAGAEERLADWSRLAQDLGRDGLQALEIDAAIPELNELANDLLHSCHGSRFTVELRTDRLSADGKRQLEGLDVRVVDTENGRDELAETYSGGECVIVGEAIALALTVLACRNAGVERPTLVRDETGAALDAANARAYVAMLRRAADALDADRVLFVSHSADTQDLADAKLHVEGGRVEVVA